MIAKPLLMVAWSASAAQPEAPPGAGLRGETMTAVFDLMNRQADVRPLGSSRIVAVSAWATHRDDLFRVKLDRLEILFFTAPITEADQTDIVEHEARELKKKDFARFVVLLDKERRITQVDMNFVVPGAAVARTLAFRPEQVAASFSNYQYDGKRLRLKSKGTFTDLNAKQEVLRLSWDVDIDLPVFDRVGR
jgi:hypothetical protein